MSRATRLESDSLGPVQVPSEAYYGAQTQRAVDNFPISGLRFSRRFLWALGLAPFTLGFSLILCPLVWVAQHDMTGRSIDRLRQQLAATPFAQG